MIHPITTPPRLFHAEANFRSTRPTAGGGTRTGNDLILIGVIGFESLCFPKYVKIWRSWCDSVKRAILIGSQKGALTNGAGEAAAGSVCIVIEREVNQTQALGHAPASGNLPASPTSVTASSSLLILTSGALLVSQLGFSHPKNPIIPFVHISLVVKIRFFFFTPNDGESSLTKWQPRCTYSRVTAQHSTSSSQSPN